MNKIKILSLVFISFLLCVSVVGYFWQRNQKITAEEGDQQTLTVTSVEMNKEAERVAAEDVPKKNDPVVEESTEGKPISEEVLPDFFGETGTFEETGEMQSSPMTDWWLNSGAYFSMKNGIGSTIQGELSKGDKRQISYKNYNASETDDGFHPQNIFRLVTKTKWRNLSQECYYKINRYILSKDENRSASNGLLLFNRYQDQDNLYYTGLRVDGTVVIKKKIKGEYFLMAQKQVYPGVYSHKKNPSLLPIGKWLGVKSEVTDNVDGTVLVKVFVDKNRTGNWQLIIQSVDDGRKYGGAVFRDSGYAGIRTDFMDAEFDDYRIEELK